MIINIVDRIADRIRWGYLLAFIILLISYILSYISTQNLIQQSKSVNHSNEVIHGIDNITRFVTQCESASRGYIVTNDTNYLLKYRTSLQKADSTFDSTRAFLADNIKQVKKMDSLRVLMNDKFAYIEKAFLIFDSTHTITPALLSGRGEGITKMYMVEQFAHHIQVEERKVRTKKNIEITDYSFAIKAFTIISLIVAILLTIYSLITFTKENREKRKASQKALLYQQQLELRVDELATLNAELVELRNSEKFAATGRISRTIAHEVRNPLTNINLATEQLKNEIEVTEDADMLFQMIARNSNRINQLISNLLDSTRVSEINFVKSSVNEVLDNSLEFALDRIDLKQIKVTKNYDKNISSILVDVEKIKIAFLNIIVNAIEAMDENGMLNITTKTSNDKCIVKISDNGRGLSKEDASRLFEPYFTTKEKGTGLGLTNTQNIILAHHAKINVESEIGKGNHFYNYI